MKPIIIANWKMNFHLQEALQMAKRLVNKDYDAQFLLAPPALYLSHFADIFKNTNICAQNVSSIGSLGRYTGEYSARMIKSCNINYAIIGHSERRVLFNETNELVRIKAENCINAKVTPIICIGEDLESRRNNNYKKFILTQIDESIPKSSHSMIIAYEPCWAIGSGVVPTIEEIAEIFAFIKTNINVVANNIQLVYGGSVGSKNYKNILNVPSNNGLILGSASLSIDELDVILRG